MALGEYIVPSSRKRNNLMPGPPKYKMCREEFGKVVAQLLADFYDAGFASLRLGNHGFISETEFNLMVKNGNTTYRDPDFIYFNWGVAREYSWVESSEKLGAAQRWLDENVSKYGLKVVVVLDKTNKVSLRYLRPKSVKLENVDSVSYEGDTSTFLESGTSSASGDYEEQKQGSLSSMAYFFSNQFNKFQTSAESELLTGERALANDEPVYNSIESVVKASMRSYSSTPSGGFVAWYPDYWGLSNNQVVLHLDLIELKNLTITQSDENYFSHVYCSGVDVSGNAVARYMSQGVVSIESDATASVSQAKANKSGEDTEASDKVSYLLDKILYIPKGEEWKYTPKELYRRYGARPTKATLHGVGAAGLIENPGDSTTNPQYIMPFLYALYNFMEYWAKQNEVSVDITFNPSLLPGMRMDIPDLGVEFYVSSVSHTMDYSSGFSTRVTAICPKGRLVSGMVDV